MRERRPRVLVLATDRAEAETLRRALAGLDGLRPEIELALDPEVARRQLKDRRYDLLVVPREHLRRDLTDGLPVVSIGGSPGDPARDGFPPSVPLPLSFTLLRQAVLRALAGAGDPPGGEAGLRDIG